MHNLDYNNKAVIQKQALKANNFATVLLLPLMRS
jgi:hypothetical protein